MHKIALLLDFTEEYHKALLRGVIRYSREHGAWIFLRLPIYYREARGVDDLIRRARDWGAKGLIGQLHSNTEIGKFRKAGISVIAQDFEALFKDVPNITGAYHETGKMGAEYFLQRGFRHFGFYGFHKMVWSRERANGFEARVRDAGFTVQHYEQRKSRSADLWYYQPAALTRWLRSLPKPVAIMAGDDSQALHLTEACRQAGLHVPAEVAVLGVDNDENICYLSDPPLSSVSLDVERGGYDTAAVMDMLLRGRKRKVSNIVIRPTHIVTRASTNAFATSDAYVDAALTFINENVERNINVGDVLRHVPLSRRSLEKRFFEVMGLPVYQYIFNLRMDRFKQQLLETDASVTEIAFGLGLTDTKNISRQFKLINGCTPTEYREQVSKSK